MSIPGVEHPKQEVVRHNHRMPCLNPSWAAIEGHFSLICKLKTPQQRCRGRMDFKSGFVKGIEVQLLLVGAGFLSEGCGIQRGP
jgi:hypothetical protein